MPSRARAPSVLALALVAAAIACRPRVDPRLVHEPIAKRTWVSKAHRDHPLVGRVYDPATKGFVDEAALAAAIAGADFVLLGEVHDNVDHHLLQARLLRAVLASGKRPALAFEMLTADQQPAVDAALARAPRDPDALAKAVDWKNSRWPPFEEYRPIFAAGLEAGLPVVAANLPREAMHGIVMKGESAVDPALRSKLARDEPVPPAILASLRNEMKSSHCGGLPDAMIDPLVLAQRARDAQMATRLAAAGEGRGAVLVTGKEHARTDRGVPAVLAKDAPGKKIVSVAFVEVDPDDEEPAGYAQSESGGEGFPFDFLVFTPGAEREDPCAGFEEKMKARQKEREKTTAAPGAPAPPALPGTAVPRGN